LTAIVRFNQPDLQQSRNIHKGGCFLLVQMPFSHENSYVGHTSKKNNSTEHF